MSRAAVAPSRVHPRLVRAAAATRRRRLAAALLGALALLTSGLATPTAAQGPIAPVDRAAVAIPPIYPAPPPGFLRLPETRSVPVGPVRDPVPGRAAPVPRGGFGDRPVWNPARLEAAVGIDARGRITSILEYTPGRFDR